MKQSTGDIKKIPVTINETTYLVPSGITILEACKIANVYIPSLCYHPDLPASGHCELCLVKIDGLGYAYSCMTQVRAKMQIQTDSPDVIERAKKAFNNFYDLKSQPESADLEDVYQFLNQKNPSHVRTAEKTSFISFNPNKCIKCSKCVRLCSDVLDIGALDDDNLSIASSNCISCGLCTNVCPTKALIETSSISTYLKALSSGKGLILIIDPASIVALQEIYPQHSLNGAQFTSKVIGAAKQLGFFSIFNLRFGNDIVVYEMESEIHKRQNIKSPMFVSICPATINFIEKLYPKLCSNLCTVKTPAMAMARVLRSKFGNSAFITLLTPCIAEKKEVQRMQFKNEINCVLTTREFISLLDQFEINLIQSKDAEFTRPFSTFSTPSALLPIPGGLMYSLLASLIAGPQSYVQRPSICKSVSLFSANKSLAALTGTPKFKANPLYTRPKLPSNDLDRCGIKPQRTTQFSDEIIDENMSHKDIQLDLSPINFLNPEKLIKSRQSLITDKVVINNKTINVAVVSGTAEMKRFIETKKYLEYDLIELSACPNGCLCGGGQPKLHSRQLCEPRFSMIDDFLKFPLTTVGVPTAMHNQEVSQLFSSPISLHTHYEPQESAQRLNEKRTASLPIVAYGSNGGRSIRYARLLATLMKTPSKTLNSITINDIRKRKMCVFICSTDNYGEAPSNASLFFDMLESTKENKDLKDVRFAILALGSSTYKENYCKAGKKLNELMKLKGGTEILPLTCIDEDLSDSGENDYIKWNHQLSEKLFLKKPKIGIELATKIEVSEDTSILKNPPRPVGFEYAEIVEKEYLSEPDAIQSFIRYLIKLPVGMTYEPGDHVLILPENEEEIVNTVLQTLKYNPDLVFTFETANTESEAEENIVPEKTSTRQMFSQFLDLAGLPPLGLMQTFLPYMNEEGKAKLQPLLDEENKEAREKYFQDTSIAMFINEFGKYGTPPLEVLVSSLPKMRSRIYSVQSDPDKARGFLELRIMEARFGEDKKRHGLCTNYLKKEGLQNVALKCMKQFFKPPQDEDTPIIMAAIGSGMSPLFSIIQHRHKQQQKNGKLPPCILFFEGKNESAYPLLLHKLINYHKSGIITDLVTTFWGDTPKKVHLQDKMKEKAAKIWDLWMDVRTPFYYCGPLRKIPEELKEILLQVIINEGWMAREEAMAVNNRHDFNFIQNV